MLPMKLVTVIGNCAYLNWRTVQWCKLLVCKQFIVCYRDITSDLQLFINSFSCFKPFKCSISENIASLISDVLTDECYGLYSMNVKSYMGYTFNFGNWTEGLLKVASRPSAKEVVVSWRWCLITTKWFTIYWCYWWSPWITSVSFQLFFLYK